MKMAGHSWRGLEKPKYNLSFAFSRVKYAEGSPGCEQP